MGGSVSCHCGRAVEPRGPDDPWDGRMNDYCYDCATNRCDCYPDECPVKYPPAQPNTCQNCVFWTRHTHYPQPTRLGDCLNKSFVGTYDIPREVPPGTVFVEIDEGWGFYTDEEFGCVHWLSKDAIA